MAPGEYIIHGNASLENLFLQKVLPQIEMANCHMARSYLDDLVDVLLISGSSLPAPSNPDVNALALDDAAEIDKGGYEYLPDHVADKRLQQGVHETTPEFQRHVDKENNRNALQEKEEDKGRTLLLAAYEGDFRAAETIQQILAGAHGKKVGKAWKGKDAQSYLKTYVLQN